MYSPTHFPIKQLFLRDIFNHISQLHVSDHSYETILGLLIFYECNPLYKLILKIEMTCEI